MLKRLLRFLSLRVEPGEENADADPGTTMDDAGSTGDETFDDLLDLAEDSGGQPKADDADSDESPAIKEAKRRADEAVRERDTDRRRISDLETQLRNATPPPQAPRDVDYDNEERELASIRAQVAAGTATNEQLTWRQWQIDSNRNIRASSRASHSALMQAQEIADRSSFDKLEITRPKVYKAYAARVEQAMNEIRSKGQAVPPRLAVLRLLIGDDIMNGKARPKTAAKKTAEPVSRVDRGRPPTVRSDVRSGGGAKTEQQKRIERLEGRPI